MQPDMIRARDVIPDGILSVQQMIREMQRFLTESIKNGMEARWSSHSIFVILELKYRAKVGKIGEDTIWITSAGSRWGSWSYTM